VKRYIRIYRLGGAKLEKIWRGLLLEVSGVRFQRTEGIAERCKLATQSLTTSGLYAHFFIKKALEKKGGP